jgi:adenosylcobyric acid synthase
MTAPVLMVLGTASSAGKSVIVTALCRIARQDGLRVAPFKAQNMSNNADVTPDGGEIGRAQSEQAAAAGIAPTVEMNPVLLKPQGDRTSQVVVNGRAEGVLHSADFFERKRRARPRLTAFRVRPGDC